MTKEDDIKTHEADAARLLAEIAEEAQRIGESVHATNAHVHVAELHKKLSYVTEHLAIRNALKGR